MSTSVKDPIVTGAEHSVSHFCYVFQHQKEIKEQKEYEAYCDDPKNKLKLRRKPPYTNVCVESMRWMLEDGRPNEGTRRFSYMDPAGNMQKPRLDNDGVVRYPGLDTNGAMVYGYIDEDGWVHFN